MSGNKGSRCYNSSISGDFERHIVGNIKTHSISESLQKKANDKEKRKRKSQEKANAMLTRLASHRVNPESAPNSEAAKEAASIAQFEYGRDLSSASSSSCSSITLSDRDIAFATHYQRLDREGINGESEFRLHFAEDAEEEKEEEEVEDNEVFESH
jgi:DNA polymerase II small subunit/DNA polymerase delta subunit B